MSGLVKVNSPGDGELVERTLFQKGPWTFTAVCVDFTSAAQVAIEARSSDPGGGIVTTSANSEAPNGFGREGALGASTAAPATVAATGLESGIFWYGGAPFSAVSTNGSVDGVLSYGVNIAGADCAVSMLAG